ncbi:MAG: sugar phosphate isomerase/epimerase [Verrucomicrobia bacterium]|nr:sugar phosphate isomerase/epimerase [Verrucomicrobiota bacterium]
MKTAITISQVPIDTAGPFVLRTPLPTAFASAAAFGFDGVELFLPDADFISSEEVNALAAAHGLAIAAVGTGAGMLRHGLSITAAAAEKREAALAFVLAMIDFGGRLHAPTILGSMQGRCPAGTSREAGLELLASGLRRCAERAARHGVPFIYEPLNRYETNLCNRLTEAARLLDHHALGNVVLLADLFHMNIEEPDLPTAIRAAGKHLGHVHFADSNRQAMGFGHTDAGKSLAALREIHYSGFLSAEILPLPDPAAAARQTLLSIRSWLATSRRKPGHREGLTDNN